MHIADDAQRQLVAALGRLPSGLFILTARHGQMETGLLTSWVQQCAFDPPTISVAIKSGRPVLDWLSEGKAFTLNILDHTQTDMVAHFGRGFPLGEGAFDGLDVDHLEDGAIVLEETLAYLQCVVRERHPVGDHLLILARVVSGWLLGEGQPMVHVRKSGMHY